MLKAVVFLALILNATLSNGEEPWQKREPPSSDDESGITEQSAANKGPLKNRSEKLIRRGTNNKLYYSPECQDDIREYCPKSNKIELNDLAVLQCIHNEVKSLSSLNTDCQHVCMH